MAMNVDKMLRDVYEDKPIQPAHSTRLQQGIEQCRNRERTGMVWECEMHGVM